MSCAAGHQFDQAKEGYWNLLQPQDRRSRNPGDADAAVMARHRWLERGYAAGLIETVRPWVVAPDSDPAAEPSRPGERLPRRTLDLGCGEGTFGPALFPDEAEDFCGIDLSRRAIKLAVRRWPAATWVVANADRILPTADESVNQVVSLFGRRPIAEIHRVLTVGGICVVAVPGEEDLIELREQVQQSGHRRSRWEVVVEEFAGAGLEFVEHKLWKEQVELTPAAIADALEMTYRAGRHSRQSRMQSIAAMRATLAADLLLFRRT